MLLPGERIDAAVLDYLRTGLAAGMVLPDPADKRLDTVRVSASPGSLVSTARAGTVRPTSGPAAAAPWRAPS